MDGPEGSADRELDPGDVAYLSGVLDELFTVEGPSPDDPRGLAFTIGHDDVAAVAFTDVVDQEIAVLAVLAGVTRVYREDRGLVCVQGEVSRTSVHEALDALWFDAIEQAGLI